jgi:hypothetical protein
VPGAKARDQSRTIPGALKRSFHQKVRPTGLAQTFFSSLLSRAPSKDGILMNNALRERRYNLHDF